MKLVFKNFIFSLSGLLLMNAKTHGQSPISVNTNEHVTVTMFFPSEVVKVIPPSVNFKFEYDASTNIGLLRGRKGNPSNLTVITENGYIFSFALKYADEVIDFNYILKTEQAIGRTNNQVSAVAGNESIEPKNTTSEAVLDRPTENKTDNSATDDSGNKAVKEEAQLVINESRPVEDTLLVNKTPEAENPVGEVMNPIGVEGDLYDVDRQEYYRIFCENNYLQKTIFKRSFRQSKKVVLKLNNILVDREEIYFVLQIENNSKKEYRVNGLSFFKESDVGQLQKIMTPRYTFNLQETIDPESINELVYVFKKFRINSKERVHVVLDELEDNRMVRLPLDDKQVNFPSN